MNEKMCSLVATARAAVEIIAAYMAHLEFERDAAKALEAMRLASVAVDALASATASMRDSLASRSLIEWASTQSIASRHGGESGAWPCFRSAISSSTSDGPIDSKCARVSGDSAIATPNVEANRRGTD